MTLNKTGVVNGILYEKDRVPGGTLPELISLTRLVSESGEIGAKTDGHITFKCDQIVLIIYLRIDYFPVLSFMIPNF